jgi:hypothetical protein
MNDGTQDELKVSFPASPTFTRIGRVTVAGLALRLGIEIAMVEKLRLAVDAAVQSLHGPGRITVNAQWHPGFLGVRLSNADITITDRSALADRLASMVGRAVVESHSVVLEVQTD